MALVITLILLAVITFMAVAFLVISRAGKGSATTTTEQTIARLAADAAFERAQAELLAPVMCSTNSYNYGLLVSTNYINSIGFIPGLSHPTNVNYDYTAARAPLTPAQYLQNLTNLLFNPRPPVFVPSRRFSGVTDFRFYVDLNRNGRFDANGFQPVINPVGGFYDTNGNWMATIMPGNTASNFFVGDPEWIGGLEFPTRNHAADNKFVYRYAYMIVPVGNTLDINFIHNQAANPTKADFNFTSPGSDFFRNQGVGAWEINLAAFLYDLNTNTYAWGGRYDYVPDTFGARVINGNAFIDAFSILTNRYAGRLITLTNFAGANAKYSPRSVAAFNGDYVDGYTAGPLMITNFASTDPLALKDPDVLSGDRTIRPWPGANNTNRFFTTQELFDPNKTSPYFTNRLLTASTNLGSYDRYTFYRLLSQLGTDSAPETPPAAPKPVVRWNVVGNDILATVTNHGYFSGDLVTLLSDRPPYPTTSFKISVTNAHTLFLLDAAKVGIAPGANLSTLDPYENAKIDLNYDNINFARGSFNAWNPTNFFTSVADRLLRRQSGMFLNHIKVYEVVASATNALVFYTNNFYTPSAHRALQLAANIYDSTTNRMAGPDQQSLLPPYPPTVFRPIFRRISNGGQPGTIVIVGYRQVTGTDLANASTAPAMIPPELAASPTNKFPELGTAIDPLERNEPLIAGIPLVIGAKKGYPNFNEFAMQNAIEISRRLQFKLDSTKTKVTSTNQLLILGITNVLGVEAWNSYAANFPRKLSMIASVVVSADLTDELGVRLLSTSRTNAGTLNITPNAWAGYNSSYPVASFKVPLATNITILPFSTYSPNLRAFVTASNLFENPANGPFYLPHWWLRLTTRVQYILIDNTNIVDYVNLYHSENPLDLAYELTKGVDCDNPVLDEAKAWCTNRVLNAAANDDGFATRGIMSQIQISKGGIDASLWQTYRLDPSVPGSKEQGIGAFWYNLYGVVNPMFPGTYYRSNTFFAPYVPVASRFTKVSWQANDPLVHYTIGDLMDLQAPPQVDNTSDVAPNPGDLPLKNLKTVNGRYEPWGRANSTKPTVPAYDLAFKDPLATSSDAWDFPTNKFPNIGWLGRVHRGTPWQTVYLKSPTNNYAQWTIWSGNPVIITNVSLNGATEMDTNILAANAITNDAAFTLPVNDRALLDNFSTAFNDNAAQGRLSVNQTNLAAWSAVLSGVVTLNNYLPDAALLNGVPALYAPATIAPAQVYNPFAPSNTLPAVARIVHGLNYARSITPSKAFTHLGDILAAPELTVASPFLNVTNAAQQKFGISDAAYERIPQQILGLLKCDSMPRFIVYSYGQSLKPADRSIVTTGPYFGLCTNYQITAEVATRAVVRIEGAPNNPHAVIESYNVLPPD